MTATPTEKSIGRPAASDHLLPQEIDYSCRTPLLFLFTAAMLWLVFSLLTGILASVKMHAPGMFAHTAALTYGRVAAVSSNAFYYGFASQAAIAIALWLFARMGRTYLVLPRCGLVAALVWNVGVALGTLGIFLGAMSHHPLFEMPAWTAPIFCLAFLVLGASGLFTFNARTERELYPSSWFLLTSFFSLPWILSVAFLLLGRYAIRGVIEAPVSIWFANNFVWLWLAPVALAIIFYFVSKLANQPLYSREFAIFGFWFYLLVAVWRGYQNMPGLPNWLPVLAGLMNMLLLIPVAAFAYNWYVTWAGHNRAKKQKDISTRYVVFSAVAFVASALLGFLLSRPSVDEIVGLTIFQHGMATWVNYGFLGMAFFAAMMHIVPRLTEIDWPSPKMTGLHFTLTVAGLVVVAGSLMLGGIIEGNSINTPSIPFNRISRQIVPFIGINSIGLLLLAAGQIALLANMVLMFKACAARCCGCGSMEVAK